MLCECKTQYNRNLSAREKANGWEKALCLLRCPMQHPGHHIHLLLLWIQSAKDTSKCTEMKSQAAGGGIKIKK